MVIYENIPFLTPLFTIPPTKIKKFIKFKSIKHFMKRYVGFYLDTELIRKIDENRMINGRILSRSDLIRYILKKWVEERNNEK